MHRRTTAALTFLFVVGVHAQDIHDPQHCLFGCPDGSPSTNDLIIREIYILSSDDLTKLADWAAYCVTKETIGPSENRVWKADPLLEDRETLEPDDYSDAHAVLHTDRGHQVPLASFTGTAHWRDTNYLSNITPQKSDLNQGPWATLEGKVRELARQPGVEGVYVMTGPLYERPMPELPRADEAHIVPSGYWKIVALPDGATAKVAAFYFDQDTPRDRDHCDCLLDLHPWNPERRKNVPRPAPLQSSGYRCAVASWSTQSSSSQDIPFLPGTLRVGPAA